MSAYLTKPFGVEVSEYRAVVIRVITEFPLNEDFNLKRERKVLSDFLSRTTGLNPLQSALIRKTALIETETSEASKSISFDGEAVSGSYKLHSSITNLSDEYVCGMRKICKTIRVTFDFYRPNISAPENPRKVITDLVKDLKMPSIQKALAISISSYAGETLATKGSLTETNGEIRLKVEIQDTVHLFSHHPCPNGIVEKVVEISVSPLLLVRELFYGAYGFVAGEKRWMVYNNKTAREQQSEELDFALQTIVGSIQKQEEIRQAAQDLQTLVKRQSEEDKAVRAAISKGKEELEEEIDSLNATKSNQEELVRRLRELERQQQDVGKFIKRLKKLQSLINEKNEKENRIKTILETIISTKTTLEEYKAEIRKVIQIILE